MRAAAASRAAALAALAALAAAAPGIIPPPPGFVPEPPSNVSPGNTTIAPELLSDIYTFAAFSHAAYCPLNWDGTLGNPLCSNTAAPRACDDYGDATTVAELTTDHEIAGNIVVAPARRQIVVSFRGTSRSWEWLRDLQIWQSPADDVCPGCLSHHGFLAAFRDVRAVLNDAVLRGLREHPDFRVVITGHSYGAAVATLAAAHLRRVVAVPADLFAYGSPRVGNRVFAEAVTAAVPGAAAVPVTARVTNRRDLVVVQPPLGPLRLYAHVSPEYWFESGFDAPAGQANPRVCEGTQEKTCAEQYWWLDLPRIEQRIADHSGYNKRSAPCPETDGKRGLAPEDILPSVDEVLAWSWDEA